MLNQKINVDQLNPANLINTYRRFGPFGPAYQIIDISRYLTNGEVLMNIHVLESNEDLEYPVSSILNDPLEAN